MKNSHFKLLRKIAGYLMCAMLFTTTTLNVSAVADLEAPSDVENVKAVAGDGSVDLSWDVALDNTAVTGYKIYYGLDSVSGPEGQYVFDVDAGDKISYKVGDLENGVAYYFAVTAYDAAGNESENYSIEVTATPEKVVSQPADEVSGSLPVMGDDGKAPSVKKAEGFTNVQIKVTFSEPVKLPEDEPQTAFQVEDPLTGEQLALLDAEVMKDDLTTVVIETVPQDLDKEYKVTAGLMLEDRYGQSIKSGTADTATYKAVDGEYIDVIGENEIVAETTDTTTSSDSLDTTSAEDVVATTDTTPTLEDTKDSSVKPAESAIVEVLSETELAVDFGSDVQLLPELTHFTVNDAKGTVVTVISEELDTEDNSKVKLLVDGLKPGTVYTMSIDNVSLVDGSDKLAIEPVEFSTPVLELKDTIAPEDVTDLLAKIEEEMVTLSWVPSTSEDMVEQIVYQSSDGTNFMQKAVLTPLVSTYEASDLVAGMKYWFKVTSRDGAGNESEGKIIEVELPQTGPGLMVLFGLSAGATALIGRRKKRS